MGAFLTCGPLPCPDMTTIPCPSTRQSDHAEVLLRPYTWVGKQQECADVQVRCIPPGSTLKKGSPGCCQQAVCPAHPGRALCCYAVSAPFPRVARRSCA
jgi:hypothetical protein